MKFYFKISLLFICLTLSKLDAIYIKEIVSFGDSLSCNGNACIHATNPASMCVLYPQGRFTDGDVWLEVFADQLNLPRPKASLAGGFNYAYGGATTGWTFSKNILNVGHQIEAYLNRVNGKADPENLFILWAGGNDIKNEIIPKQLLSNLKRHITDLAKAGGKFFFVPNYPPLLKTPLLESASSILGIGLGRIVDYFDYEGDQVQEIFTSFVSYAADVGTRTLNKQLEKMLHDLERSLDITIYYFDTYTLFYAVKEDLKKFGLNENDHLFIHDGFHPSSFVHKILGLEASKLINNRVKKRSKYY